MQIKDGMATGWPRGLLRIALAGMAIRELVTLWFTRAKTRRILAELDDTTLQDIGLRRWDVEHEARKPFWQA